MPATLFVSDLHLSPERPAQVDAFHAFCAGPAREAAGVYVLGDLFDAWIGDDALEEPLPAQVARAIKGVTAAGVPVGVITGNRDFLLGERFCAAAGVTLLPGQLVVNVGGAPTLVLHGDELCTSDHAYQRFRRIAHDARWQRAYLALPYAMRRGIARWLRRRSRAANAGKPEQIMDVEPDAVAAAFRDAGVSRMIHGHTHRPARHHLVVDGRACERFVLADWYERGSYLEFDQEGGRTRDVAAPAA
ncbi:MAG TPA: UDP-2,3-diacylglucosamine diphosphatase [Casimicrobiaceae bacterium]|nr:UDP-2,3-diacylglucosamine diphosphatase [Casimicrobiaceae bacterium]